MLKLSKDSKYKLTLSGMLIAFAIGFPAIYTFFNETQAGVPGQLFLALPYIASAFCVSFAAILICQAFTKGKGKNVLLKRNES